MIRSIVQHGVLAKYPPPCSVHGTGGAIFLFPINYSLVSHLFHCTRLCPIVTLILSPPCTTVFLLLYLGYVMYLVKLVRYLTRPHHHLTAFLYSYMCACKCQLFTDEGSHKLPKCLNYCFSVQAIVQRIDRYESTQPLRSTPQTEIVQLLMKV